MKCPYCSADVSEGDKFCGECGKDLHVPLKVRAEENPIWKWGSMISSLALILIFLSFCIYYILEEVV